MIFKMRTMMLYAISAFMLFGFCFTASMVGEQLSDGLLEKFGALKKVAYSEKTFNEVLGDISENDLSSLLRHSITSNGGSNMCKMLVKALETKFDSDIDKVQPNGQTLLEFAISSSSCIDVAVLLTAGADIARLSVGDFYNAFKLASKEMNYSIEKHQNLNLYELIKYSIDIKKDDFLQALLVKNIEILVLIEHLGHTKSLNRLTAQRLLTGKILSSDPKGFPVALTLAYDNDLNDLVSTLVARNVKEHVGVDGRTLLHRACEKFDVKMVSILLSRGYDVDARTTDGVSPIGIVVNTYNIMGNNAAISIINLLIEYDADLKKIPSLLLKDLVPSYFTTKYKILKALRGDVEKFTKSLGTLSTSDVIKAAKLCIKTRGDGLSLPVILNFLKTRPDWDINELVETAVDAINIEAFDILIQEGGNTDRISGAKIYRVYSDSREFGSKLIQMAAADKVEGMVKKIAYTTDIEYLKALLQKNLALDMILLAFAYCQEYRSKECVDLVFAKLVESHAENLSKALTQAVEGNFTVLVSKLLDMNVVPEIDDDGKTLLHKAAENGCVGTALLLISRGFDVNAVTVDGDTPLISLLYSKMGGN